VETLADEKWDKFVTESLNGTIFTTSIYLNASGVSYKLYFCYKKEELRSAIMLIESSCGKKIILDDLIIYNGIMYNKPMNKQNHAQQFSEQFKIQDFIASELIKIYDNIEMSLHPTIVDIRAIQWINYGMKLPKYNFSCSPSAILEAALVIFRKRAKCSTKFPNSGSGAPATSSKTT